MSRVMVAFGGANTDEEWVDDSSLCLITETHRGKTFYVGSREGAGEWVLMRFYGEIGSCAAHIGTYSDKGQCLREARRRTE